MRHVLFSKFCAPPIEDRRGALPSILRAACGTAKAADDSLISATRWTPRRTLLLRSKLSSLKKFPRKAAASAFALELIWGQPLGS